MSAPTADAPSRPLTAAPVAGPDLAAAPSPRLDRRRLVAAIVLVIAIVALAVMAWTASHTVRSVTEVRPASAVRATPLTEPPAIDTGTLSSLPTFPAGAAPIASPAAVPPPSAPTPDAPSAPPAVAPPALDGPTRIYEPCPALGLPAPTNIGGVAQIVPLVPLFGPFAAEAFGFMPALQPGIEFFGPFMPALGDTLGDLTPALEALQPGAATLGQAGFDALLPLYGGVRPQFLTAEADLATALQPLVAAIAEAPGSECAIALEAVLADKLTALKQ